MGKGSIANGMLWTTTVSNLEMALRTLVRQRIKHVVHAEEASKTQSPLQKVSLQTLKVQLLVQFQVLVHLQHSPQVPATLPLTFRAQLSVIVRRHLFPLTPLMNQTLALIIQMGGMIAMGKIIVANGMQQETTVKSMETHIEILV